MFVYDLVENRSAELLRGVPMDALIPFRFFCPHKQQREFCSEWPKETEDFCRT
jgi:hypothetical protein